MPAELLAKWLAALRSSSVAGAPVNQAKAVLCDGNGGYCCLGVLQMVASGRTERNQQEDELPGYAYLSQRGIEFLSSYGEPNNAPYLPALGVLATKANDDGKTFAEIADAIEACAKGY